MQIKGAVINAFYKFVYIHKLRCKSRKLKTIDFVQTLSII